MPVKNLIFDLDGTLIDSADGVVESVNYSLRMVGAAEQTAEKIRSFIGFPLSQMYPQFTNAPVKELYGHFQDKAAETIVQSTRLLDGVQILMPFLKQSGYRLAIASTKVRRHVDGILDRFNWRGLFDAVVGGDEVAHVKPAPDAFLLALERLGAQPNETLVIGDTINDVQAARGVPMEIAAVSSPYGGREQLLASAPDYFMERIDDLPELLGRLKNNSMA